MTLAALAELNQKADDLANLSTSLFFRKRVSPLSELLQCF